MALEITPADLAAFHAKHFSSVSVTHFSANFLGPVEEEEYYDEEDDGLGYYDDGVKRTLTDEQIAMFRHSEIESLLREQRHAREARDDSEVREAGAEQKNDAMEDGAEHDDGGIFDTNAPVVSKQKKKKGRKGGQGKSFFKQNVKPDLRKRTWDKVDKGLDDLAYDDADGSATQDRSSAPQRRRISYDD
ncbi:hypothetical protein BP5796_03267 [Coleophoma crateriformis]|uniref:Uncharacterized protein n=1 Tax=Coleophoma crateriformis TaxID=565419 RepID=A0A3D8SMM1_9HELO|nr:hypothetical protein BP5796_03267 [Coleophoma crateriformis]